MSTNLPSFDRAEYTLAPTPGNSTDQCTRCQQPIDRGQLAFTLLGLGLASPFLELSGGIGGFIGLFILFIGIRAAWRLTSGTDPTAPDISGPFSNQSGPAPAV